jgi:predicted RNA-binding protein YlqC (UPF0109 family)
MGWDFLKNLFSSKPGEEKKEELNENTPQTTEPSKSVEKPAVQQSAVSAPAGDSEADPVEFVRFTVSQLVSKPDEVKVTVEEGPDPDMMTIMVACNKQDMGRVIGKKGRTIAALRSLARDAAGRAGKKIKLEVLE